MDEKIKQLLYGSLLGDGSLYIPPNGQNAFYSETHSLLQKDYLLFKLNIFKQEFFFNVREYLKRNEILMQSRLYPSLTKLYNVFYPDKKKIVTAEILDELSPFGLAIWFCDDGTYKLNSGVVSIASYSRSKKEFQIIKNYFKSKWNIGIKINSGCICFNVKETNKFLSLIEKDFPRGVSMVYKLGHFDARNLANIQKAKAKVLKYRLENREKIKKYNQQRRLKNRERLLKQGREYYYAHREEMNLKYKKYYYKNKERENARCREYYYNNLEKERARGREYYRKHKIRTLSKEAFA